MSASPSSALVALELRADADVVTARQRARQVAELLGFDVQDQTRFATAVSEIARNAVRYARYGRMELRVDGPPGAQLLAARVEDRGPGIAALDEVLDGRYVSRTGMGMGIAGTRRLMDTFALDSRPGEGTVVELGKRIPRTAPPVDDAARARVAAELARQAPPSAVDEVQRQNRELIAALAEARSRQEELHSLNKELADTNRGVVALYAELDERVDQLRRANALRAQFMSYMSHEFRTPLDSMLALTGLLLDRVDGELTEEQEKQVAYVRRSARDLLNLVDDLLDTARVDAGKVAVHASRFTIPDLFDLLRATLRPLLAGEKTQLVFEDASALPELETDEAKVAQILRNFISNALKFTEGGEVRVTARMAEPGRVALVVADTGIGIAAEDLARIFEDFGQVDGALQRRRRGTGLGLPLSRKLGELLGGRVSVESRVGQGSTFTLELPATYQRPEGESDGGVDDGNA
ncbi:ATP-binding protein [Longimicrobium sp.]|uniref:ATP-binding protein n=1 Tax=Longimicrobium sp. TaxID=2029185 RepID=UPI002CC8825C|nr:ATP-binding protein [Longimicrobium sp.]HSU13239.1 ATP-binding protein [Longimicrobium sp.]